MLKCLRNVKESPLMSKGDKYKSVSTFCKMLGNFNVNLDFETEFALHTSPVQFNIFRLTFISISV